MIIEFILVILIVAIIGKIFTESYTESENTDTFINIGTPFAKGLSKYQTDEDETPSSQILKPNTMPNQNKAAIDLEKISIISDQIDNNRIYSQIVKDTKKSLNKKKRRKHKSRSKEKCNIKHRQSENNIRNVLPCKKLNKFFVETQFNNNYRDVLTVFNNICPDQKILFNIQALPVTATKFTTKDMPFEFVKLISQFINRVNQEIDKLPESYEIVNNYNNYMPLTSQLKKYTENKGINIFYKSIGVDFNLYPDLPVNAPIELIDIIGMTKEFTEHETKYIATFVIKKTLESVTDQLKITVHFIIKNNPAETCDMFESCSEPQDINSYQKVAIEFIFVDGVYTDDFNIDYDCIDSCQTNNKKVSNIDTDNQFYSYSELGKDNMLDRTEILTQFNKKLKQHELEMLNFDINNPYKIYKQGEEELVNPRNNF